MSAMQALTIAIRTLLLMGAASAALALPALTGGEIAPTLARAVAPQEDPSNARVIVKYRDGPLTRPGARAASPRPQRAEALSQQLRLVLANGRVLGPRTQGLRASGLSSAQLATRLEAHPEVEWAVPDRRRRIRALPNDPYLGPGQTTITPTVGQWYLRAPEGAAISAINAVGAWTITNGSPAITVAVLDTGVRLDHPDLAGKLHPGYDFIDDTTTANDGGGRDADASDPGDWNNANECSAGEPASHSSWHGTQVAGLIGAATDNGIGMAGVGRNLMLLPVRVLGRCGGYDSDIIAGMRWAAALSSEVGIGTVVNLVNPHPARVINMSLGSSGSCDAPYREVLAELGAAGVTVVVAAGNANGLAVDSPANCPGAIAVAGLRHTGTKVGYSSLGPEVAISAPAGNCVNQVGTCLYPLLTTTNLGVTTPGENVYSDGSSSASLGTSFSAPIVAATVGLMLSANPTLTPAKLRTALQSSARAFPQDGADAAVTACHAPGRREQIECYCSTSTCGAGLLDAAQAVAAVALPLAIITVSSSAAQVGSVVQLNATDSSALGGRSIAAYQWSITAGAAIAAFSGVTNASSATLGTTAPGNVTVQLSVTDSSGAVASSSVSITVTAPVVVAPGPAASSLEAAPAAAAAKSGGGALDWPWLLVLAAALVGLRTSRPARAGADRSPVHRNAD